MASGTRKLIPQLEQEKAVIEGRWRRCTRLEGSVDPAPASQVRNGRSARPGMTRGRKQRLIAALEKRWAAEKRAAKKAAAGLPAPAKAPAKRKGGMTPEGRKRLAEAMRRRWAAKGAASAVKKTERRQQRKRPDRSIMIGRPAPGLAVTISSPGDMIALEVRDEIVAKLRTTLTAGVASEERAVYVMRSIRKLLEIDGAKQKYPALNFYCNSVP